MAEARSTSQKNVILGLIFLAFAVFFVLFFGLKSAQAAGAGCYDITGIGKEVLVNGVENSGKMHFGPPPAGSLAPDFQYQACVADTSAPPPGDGPFTVKGWAWDDNLGWISLYCADEDGIPATPRTNLGIPCGNYDYEVRMGGLNSLGYEPGRLYGYAWGDNTGWISFNCADTGTCGPAPYYVEAETADNACLGEVYSSSPPDGSCAVNLNESTYAWSDNVGWIDFTGVKFPWVELISIAVEVDLEIVNASNNDLAVVGANKLEAPVADGSDSWDMILHMTKQYDGSPLTTFPTDPSSIYTITVNLSWTDSVDTDQTNLVFDSFATTKPTAFPAGFAAYGASVSDAYVADITSRAPTSSMNGYDEDNDGSVNSSYESFVLGNPNGTSDVPTNDLVLTDVQVSVVHTPTGICAFGGAGCGPQSVAGPYLGTNLHFKPAVEVDEMSDQIGGATISARYGVANIIDYSIACLGNLVGCGGVDISTVAGVKSPFVFTYDDDNNNPNCQDVSTFNLLSVPSSPLLLYPWFVFDGAECPTGTASDFGNDAYVYTTVEYNNGGTIRYFSNKLPRVEGTLVVNPVAEIRGNVYSTGVTNPQTGQEVRSLGDVSTNILRDTIVRNVENIVAGVEAFGGNSVNITGYDEMGLDKGFQVSDEEQLRRLLPDIVDVPKAYYFTGDVIITDPLDWRGERTIIIRGGNLYIKGNILATTSVIGKPKLGLIVLDDLTTPTTKEGNIYIGPEVTNIQANIYADGSVFSYDGAAINPSSGEPVWDSEAARFNLLKNQLYVEGSIASQNTIGGAVKFPPILGDGTVEPTSVEGQYGSEPEGRSRARLYDLNFLRYYGLVFERDVNGNAVDQQSDLPGDPGYLELTPKTEGGDLVPILGGNPAQGLDPNADFSAVYVNFDPPTASLPGFGVTGGVDIRIRP